MQKVEGSNPFSRSQEKPRARGAFLCSVNGCTVAVTFCFPALLPNHCHFLSGRSAPNGMSELVL
jgi:hypothetical protein